MYTAHVGLREPSFTLTPNPAYVYFSHHHQEALAHLLYGTGEDGGFVQLTGNRWWPMPSPSRIPHCRKSPCHRIA